MDSVRGSILVSEDRIFVQLVSFVLVTGSGMVKKESVFVIVEETFKVKQST
jgi:hypothetical protein